jgi:nitrate reductase molybdenum cofactor assembly chaperone NarJ/NarW
MAMLALRALGALLSYPETALRAALSEIAGVLEDCRAIPAASRAALKELIDEIGAMDQLDAEERYVELFDRGRATSLNLFEHLHGDARDRGQAMVDLKTLYERAGFSLATAELPDHLPVLLEYLSCREMAEIRDMLGDCADIVRGIGEALLKRDSRYAAVFEALLAIAKASPLDPARAKRRPAERIDLDRDWRERPAFEPDAGRPGAGFPTAPRYAPGSKR